MILPYYVEEGEQGDRDAKLHSETYLRENLPLTWEYFEEHRERLCGRESGRMRGHDDWYGFTYPKSHERFEQSKLIAPAISMDSRFMLDRNGDWYFKTGYGIQASEAHRSDVEMIAGQLNSNSLKFYFKHIAALKISGAYEYRAQFAEKLPYI